MEAHKRGLLHRAFSVFIFNSKGQMLLQKRAPKKYHSGGLWSNACCGHPYPGEEVDLAAVRRLREEMGFTTHLEKIFDFTYHLSFENGLTENEFDHVFVGEYDGSIHPDANEVTDYTFTGMNEIREHLSQQPETYTGWFQIAFPKIEDWLRESKWQEARGKGQKARGKRQ